MSQEDRATSVSGLLTVLVEHDQVTGADALSRPHLRSQRLFVDSVCDEFSDVSVSGF